MGMGAGLFGLDPAMMTLMAIIDLEQEGAIPPELMEHVVRDTLGESIRGNPALAMSVLAAVAGDDLVDGDYLV